MSAPSTATLGQAALSAYLLGSIPFSALIARAHGVDLRAVGSGNVGATNVARALGLGWGLLALALDAGKGAAAVLVAERLGLTGAYTIAAGFVGILGHVFSCFLGFRGGKGVATSLGVFLALAPRATAMAFVVFVGVLATTRYVSLGSLVSSFALAVMLVAERGLADPVSRFGLVAWLLVLLRHRANISRLMAGTESRFGERAAPADARGRNGS